MKPGMITSFSINDVSILELQSGPESILIEIKNSGEKEGRSICLEPEEIDVFITALTMYKNKILNYKK